MELFDGFLIEMRDESNSFSDETINTIRELCNKCDVFYGEIEAINLEMEYDSAGKIFSMILYSDSDEITIKKDSLFWEIIKISHGFLVEYADQESKIVRLIFNIVCS